MICFLEDECFVVINSSRDFVQLQKSDRKLNSHVAIPKSPNLIQTLVEFLLHIIVPHEKPDIVEISNCCSSQAGDGPTERGGAGQSPAVEIVCCIA